jgi:CRP-like cAMP-binding protein
LLYQLMGAMTVETLEQPVGAIPRPAPLPRPRRRPAGAPPAPADPTPWQQVLGDPALTNTEFHLLTRLSSRRSVPSGSEVLPRGGIADCLVLLLCGDVVLGARAPDGSMRTERTLCGPAWLDISAAWIGEPYAYSVQALSDVTVADLLLADLKREFVAQPQLAQRFCACLAREVQDLAHAARNLLHHDAPARFALWLAERCPDLESACVIRLQERKRDIAQQLAMTPETLSRLMRSFESQGVLSVQGYNLRVHDVAALQRIAGETA